jgi:hypothetical protein
VSVGLLSSWNRYEYEWFYDHTFMHCKCKRRRQEGAWRELWRLRVHVPLFPIDPPQPCAYFLLYFPERIARQPSYQTDVPPLLASNFLSVHNLTIKQDSSLLRRAAGVKLLPTSCTSLRSIIISSIIKP